MALPWSLCLELTSGVPPARHRLCGTGQDTFPCSGLEGRPAGVLPAPSPASAGQSPCPGERRRGPGSLTAAWRPGARSLCSAERRRGSGSLSATWRQCSGSMSREAIAGFGVPVPRGARVGPGVPIPLSEDEVLGLGPGSLTAEWRRGSGSLPTMWRRVTGNPCPRRRRRAPGSLTAAWRWGLPPGRGAQWQLRVTSASGASAAKYKVLSASSPLIPPLPQTCGSFKSLKINPSPPPAPQSPAWPGLVGSSREASWASSG